MARIMAPVRDTNRALLVRIARKNAAIKDARLNACGGDPVSFWIVAPALQPPTKMDDMANPDSAKKLRRIPRSMHWQVLRRTCIVIRTSSVLLLASVALTAGLAWSANWVFPLAVLQTVGLSNRQTMCGVTWEASVPPGEDFPTAWVGIRGGSAHFRFYRYYPHRRTPQRRYFYTGPWPAGIRTVNVIRPIRRVTAVGTTTGFRSYSWVFLELPLWALCPILGAYPLMVLLRGPIRRHTRRRRGLCLWCGYDLRLLKECRCPECGSTFNGK